MSLGAGFEYLMSSVVRGDGAAPSGQALTRYYLESGTPPGRFLGAGLAGLADGAGVKPGTEVTEEALWWLLGMMSDPVTGEPLGRRPSRHFQAGSGRAVAGFDLTFSVPKSVSVLWALADADTQAVIHQAHRDAIDIALAWAEQNIAFTRTGAGGRVQASVRGLIAAAFDHWDSRAGDPHLHTHVVVANRVQTADGTWRSLDGATLFRHTVALSELHEGVLQDLLTERLGVGWTTHPRRHSLVPRWDLDGIPAALLEEFSTRSRAINTAKDDLVEAFVAAHGRHPSNVETLRLRQQATLQTRPDKARHSLAEQMAGWRTRAAKHSGDGSVSLPELQKRSAHPALASNTIEAGMLDALAQSALTTVAAKRAVFGEANVLAEVHRHLHGTHFASSADRLAVAEQLTQRALSEALALENADGRGLCLHRGAARYTTAAILDAESRLLDAGRELEAPIVDEVTLSELADAMGSLSGGQRDAVTAIATSGRALDVLVGPAGAGKTTTLAALKTAWEADHGPGSVRGLAPSAAAAQVLADELGIATDNTAKWQLEQQRRPERTARIAELTERLAGTRNPGSLWSRRIETERLRLEAEIDRWAPQPGELLIIDEASLAGTLVLDAIADEARDLWAKVVLVGDPAQLGAIEAGGAFHMLVADRTDTPTLTEVHRFTEHWEADASLQLRVGDTAAIGAYLDHDRVHSGDRDLLLHELVDAWHTDTQDGLDSIMIAGDDTSVRDLNALAQAHRRDTGTAEQGETPLADGHTAGIGDTVITRHNDRRLHVGNSWVKNGDTWTVTGTHSDGSLTVTDRHDRTLRLAADYTRDHVELGYATTVHRAQGRTVDTSHAFLDDTTTREALYVAATRARTGNHLYLTTETAADTDDLTHDTDTDTEDNAARLARILDRTASTAAAHTYLQQPRVETPEFVTVPTIASPRRWIAPSTPSHHLGI